MTKREIAITGARIAGYHDGQQTLIRLYVEARVKLGVMKQAFFDGQQARINGVKCNCCECKQQDGTL